jgi:hypothetical protein
MKSFKNIMLITVILLSPKLILSQELEMKGLTLANDNWGQEFFQFPLSFAPEIEFTGMEEARFPKGWANTESPEFWSYAFAWEIDAEAQLTKSALEHSLQLYFDGLLSINTWQKNDSTVQRTNALFVEKTATKSNSHYTGKIKIFESRYTKKPMTLNVTIEQHYCETNQKVVILFNFSPKEFEHDTWVKLAEVTLRKDLCK